MMKIIYLGTPDFAVKPLYALYNAGYEILAVITQPDKPVGRKGIVTASEVKKAAISLNLKVLQFNHIKDEGVEVIKALKPDIMITCAYGQILSEEILNIPEFGILNIHASILPKYRGASPIQWAIINGDDETGVTIMQTEKGIDTGDILSIAKTKILENETAGELFDKLSNIGAKLIVDTLENLEKGNIVFHKQDESKASLVKLIKKTDAKINFALSADEIHNFIRGFNPWPIAFAYLDDKMLKIYSCEVINENGNPGQVIFCDKNSGLIIACGKGAIKICELQIEGSKKMLAKDFILGRNIQGKVLS